MTKFYQDINYKDDQQESLLTTVRAVLNKHSLNFSEQGIRTILEAIKSYQSSLIIPTRPTKSKKRKQIQSLKSTAIQLSNQIKELSPYISLDDRSDSLPLILDHLVQCCEYSLAHYNYEKSLEEGRPVKALPLKILVQNLILIFEKETGKNYVIEESSQWGRERKAYDPLNQEYVTSILESVAPGEDAQEVMKAARRSPLPLDWVRNIRKMIDEDFQNNPGSFK